MWSVNAHATSTPLGDRAECTAIRQVAKSTTILLENNQESVLNGQVVKEGCLVTSNKGSLGHTLGAAGALESIFSVMSLAQVLLENILL